MKQQTIWNLTATFILFAFIQLSCTKVKSTELGADLIPAIDNINTFDTTLDVITDNFIMPDSALPRITYTTNGSAPDMILGIINNDPLFGKTKASIFLQFVPPFFPFGFETRDSIYLDSLVLTLKWRGDIIGDSTQPQRVVVYNLEQAPRIDSAYPINASLPLGSVVGNKTFTPAELNDSLYLFRENTANQLRIKLNTTLGQNLLILDSTSGNPYFIDSLFRKYLKGFAIVPDENFSINANALMSFNISDTNSYLRMYYRYEKSGKKDTTFKSFRYSLSAGFLNNITRNYQGSAFQQSLGPDSDSVVFIQTTPGSYSRIRIPSLNNFATVKGNVLIHRAELVVTQIPSSTQNDGLFPPPDYLYVDYLDSVNKAQKPFALDAFPDGTYSPAFFGGFRRYISIPGVNTAVAQYRFNVSRHVQGIITRKDPNFPIYLYSPFLLRYPDPPVFSSLNPLAKGRVMAGGGSGKSIYKMYIRLVYSKI